MLEIEKQFVDALIAYLMTRPYQEVANAIATLQSLKKSDELRTNN